MEWDRVLLQDTGIACVLLHIAFTQNLSAGARSMKRTWWHLLRLSRANYTEYYVVSLHDELYAVGA